MGLCTVWVCTAPCVHVCMCEYLCKYILILLFVFFLKLQMGLLSCWQVSPHMGLHERRPISSENSRVVLFWTIKGDFSFFADWILSRFTLLRVFEQEYQTMDVKTSTPGCEHYKQKLKTRNFMFAGREKRCHLVKQKLCHAAGRSISLDSFSGFLLFWAFFLVFLSFTHHFEGKTVLIPALDQWSKLLCNAALANTPGLQCGYLWCCI